MLPQGPHMARERRALRDRLRLSGFAGRRGRAVHHRETPDSRTVPGGASEWEEIDEVLGALNRDIKLRPADAWAISSRGQTYLGLGRYDEALADLDRAIELYPAYSWAIARRGETYMEMERYAKALADLDHAIELAPEGDAWATGFRGETYRRMGRLGEALADFNRAIELDPTGRSTLKWRLTQPTPPEPGPSAAAARPAGCWAARRKPWQTSRAPLNSTPATSPPGTKRVIHGSRSL